MHINDDGIGAAFQRTGGKLSVDRGERIVERLHEDAAHGIDDKSLGAVLGVDHGGAASRGAGRKVDRTNEPRRALDEHQRLALVPGVIA